ncbi:MAG TPA: preprotein translocase subunit YajC [Alphaproteobacteria bacterium]|jgi:preprotein translocase subunit YajC
MLISPAYAQAAGGGGLGGDGMLTGLLPIILIFVVFWFLLIRPQQKRMKEHKAMIANLRRGDKVVTGGGIIGTITKVLDEGEVEVEIASDVKVRVARATITDVLNKTAPVAAKGGGGKGAADAADDDEEDSKSKRRGSGS